MKHVCAEIKLFKTLGVGLHYFHMLIYVLMSCEKLDCSYKGMAEFMKSVSDRRQMTYIVADTWGKIKSPVYIF